jgi:hypothetical protein
VHVRPSRLVVSLQETRLSRATLASAVQPRSAQLPGSVSPTTFYSRQLPRQTPQLAYPPPSATAPVQSEQASVRIFKAFSLSLDRVKQALARLITVDFSLRLETFPLFGERCGSLVRCA